MRELESLIGGKMRSIIAPMMVVFITACAAMPSRRASEIKISDTKSVESCVFLATLDAHVNDFWNVLAPSDAPTKAKTEVLEKAVVLNATNLVWLNIAGSNVAANAYQCKGSIASR